jgi:hypothetical protein
MEKRKSNRLEAYFRAMEEERVEEYHKEHGRKQNE